MKKIVVLLTLAVLLCAPLFAEVQAGKKIVVNISEIRPCVFMEDGKPTGFSIDLWELVSKEIGLDCEYKVTTFGETKENLRKGTVDVVVAGMTITHEREKEWDFSLPELDSGQSIVVPQDEVIGGMKKFWKDFCLQGD